MIQAGDTFERLRVLERAPPPPAYVSTAKATWWRCACVCGKVKDVRGDKLSSGKVKSCGCLRDERRRLRNNGVSSKHPLYHTWAAMMHRCTNPKHPAFPEYGGRGITVCPEWQTFPGFVVGVGERPDFCTMDRIDNDRGYEPGNVRWATAAEQAGNRRQPRSVVLHGERMTLQEAAAALGRTPEEIRGWVGLSLQQVVDRFTP